MSNSSSDPQDRINYQQVAINILYMITGGSTVLGDLAIIGSVLLFKHLRSRKELLLISAQCFGDGLYGFGFFVGGSRRLYLFLNRMSKIPVSPWHCMHAEVATFFYLIGPQASSLMNLVISIDRLISVAFISLYTTLRTRYMIVIIFSGYGYAALSYLTGFGLSYFMPRDKTVYLQCLSTWASTKGYAVYYTALISTAEITSIILYIVVMMVLKYRTMTSHPSLQHIQHNRQVKVTQTISLIVCSTLLLYVIPWLTHSILNALGVKGNAGLISPLMWVVIQSNNILNVVIYLWKLTEVRGALKNLVTGRCGKVGAEKPPSRAAIRHVRPGSITGLTPTDTASDTVSRNVTPLSDLKAR